ncbi:MAG: gamma-glutamyltransferase [Candidatus Competibacteraceae bacterium]
MSLISRTLPGPHSYRTFTYQRFIYGIVITLFSVGWLSGSALAAPDDNNSPGTPGVQGGIVATTEPLAAQVGAGILREGGNAIDAAAAVQFALNVVEPQSSGIGGGGFMMIYLAKPKQVVIVDSRETAPAAPSTVNSNMFMSASNTSQPFPFAISSTSGIAVGVPGTVRGVATALQKWGTLSFSDVLQPAIKLAEDGIRVSARLADSILDPRLSSEPGNSAYNVARAVFRPGGVAVKKGDLLKQPELANTFRLLAKDGPDAFYTGDLARVLIETQQNARKVDNDGVLINDADQQKLKGSMTLDDLKNYKVAIRTPVEGTYRGYRIVSMPPPSSGGLTLIQTLKMLERFPIGDISQGYGFGAANTLHVMIEALRLAFADRAVWMGDADFVPVPSVGLLNPIYLALRGASIDPDSRQGTVVAGDPRPYEDGGKRPGKLAPTLETAEGMNTTHFVIADRDGNIVSYTTTIESAWGTGLMVPGYGFMLNNELTDFNNVPALNRDPNNFNPGANDVAPGKRPRSSMAPTLIFYKDKPLAAFGSPGGSTIISSVLNMTLNLIDHGMPVQEAIDAPRIAQTGASDKIRAQLEQGFSEATMQALCNLGDLPGSPACQQLLSLPPIDIGAIQVVASEKGKGDLFGGADKRRTGSVISVRLGEIQKR